MQIHRLLPVALAGCLLGCSAKVIVVKVPTDKPAVSDGIIYALPNTVVRLQLKVDKTEYTAARYARYAAIFAPEGKPVCKDQDCSEEKKKTFSIQENTTFSTYGEPDPDNVFLVKFVGRGAIDQSISMTWNEVGLASAASASVTNRTGDVILSTLKLAAGLGTKAAAGAAKANDKKEQVCDPDPSDSDTKVINILTQEMVGDAAAQLIANYCAIKKPDRDKIIADSVLVNATRDYAKRILPLANARIKILTGAPGALDSAALLPRIETEIDHQLTVLYLGTKKATTWDGTLDIRNLPAEKDITVLKIDAEKGVCVGAAEVPPQVKPIPSAFSRDVDCAKAKPVNLRLEFYPPASNQLFKRITDSTEGERSFRYRVPAQVSATLSSEEEKKGGEGKKVYGAGVFSVAQLGTTVSLPANRHSKALSYDLAFIEATGGLKTFKLGTTGILDTATIDALSSVGGTLVDARNAARKNDDEVTILTKEDQLLKLRDDICTIQKKYGLPCTVAPQ
jgi:Domain of unknown function (DUF4831)